MDDWYEWMKASMSYKMRSRRSNSKLVDEWENRWAQDVFGMKMRGAPRYKYWKIGGVIPSRRTAKPPNHMNSPFDYLLLPPKFFPFYLLKVCGRSGLILALACNSATPTSSY